MSIFSSLNLISKLRIYGWNCCWKSFDYYCLLNKSSSSRIVHMATFVVVTFKMFMVLYEQHQQIMWFLHKMFCFSFCWMFVAVYFYCLFLTMKMTSWIQHYFRSQLLSNFNQIRNYRMKKKFKWKKVHDAYIWLNIWNCTSKLIIHGNYVVPLN